MQNRQKTWLWISAIVSMIMGLILVWGGTSAGWFLVALGIVNIGAASRTGKEAAALNPEKMRWALIGATLLVILLAAILGAIFLWK